MIKKHWYQIAPALFLLTGLAGGVVTAADAAKPGAGNVTDASVKANRASGEDWPVYGGRLTGEHYSPLDQIKASNVEKLGLAWASDIPRVLASVRVTQHAAIRRFPTSGSVARNPKSGGAV